MKKILRPFDIGLRLFPGVTDSVVLVYNLNDIEESFFGKGLRIRQLSDKSPFFLTAPKNSISASWF